MIIAVILLEFLMALVFPLGRIIIRVSQPIFVTGTRMLLGGIILLVYFYFRFPQQWREFIKLRYIGIWLLLAIFNIYLTNVLEFWGLQTLSAAKACFIYNLSPLFAVLYSYLFFDEHMTIKKWLGLLIGFFGFFPVLLRSTPTEELLGGIYFLSWAELALIGAAIATSFGWIMMRRSIRKKSYPLVLANGISMLIGGIFALLTSLLFEHWDPLPVTDYKLFLIYLLIFIFISNLTSYNLYAFLLKYYTATFLSFAGFICPLFTAFIAWLFLGEIVTWVFFFSSALIFLGLYIFYQEELHLGYIINKNS